MALFEEIFDGVKEPMRDKINEEVRFEITDESKLKSAAEELMQAVLNKEWSKVGDIASEISSYTTKNKPITRESKVSEDQKADNIIKMSQKAKEGKKEFTIGVDVAVFANTKEEAIKILGQQLADGNFQYWLGDVSEAKKEGK
jgi:hypothetical protein